MSIASGLGLFVVVAVPFVPAGVAVALVAVALAPALAAAALEVGLVGDVQALHQRLAAAAA
jgi:Mrp family chromosome partitioning ATPase